MGYDIEARRPLSPPADPLQPGMNGQVSEHVMAYLEMASHSPDARALFEALDAVEYDGIVSGCGIGRFFTNAQIRVSLRRLCAGYLENKVSERTLRFLAQVADAMHDEPWVYIDFG